MKKAFTLIELLVVVGVMGILAGLLLPALVRAKEQAKTTACLNNLRQIGIAIELYKQEDSGTRFPNDLKWEDRRLKPYPLPQEIQFATYALGGRDPKPAFTDLFPLAVHRPLFPYLKQFDVFHCPRDAGQRLLPWGSDRPTLKPSLWETVGCSYQYNCGEGNAIPEPPGHYRYAAQSGGLANGPESWVSLPVKYILIYEPPARPYGYRSTLEWYQWHNRDSVSDIGDVKKAPPLFYSPTLYVDSHCQMNNFSKSLQDDPHYPYEETKDWMWYKPRE